MGVKDVLSIMTDTKIGLILLSYVTLMKNLCDRYLYSFTDVENRNYTQDHTTNEWQSQDKTPPQNHVKTLMYSS